MARISSSEASLNSRLHSVTCQKTMLFLFNFKIQIGGVKKKGCDVNGDDSAGEDRLTNSQWEGESNFVCVEERASQRMSARSSHSE